ncbi:MAG: hypothetical protein NUW06_08060 [Candidatus Acetothermia bacterium]|jgi:hypothetical protein|nr:hypothetical protein [Candidatus Acetothermia bacterium]MDH7505964.1 hypothetical protein [Candidatus Acetothermia bacterium]
MLIFEVRSRLARRVRLTKAQWDHITSRHRELKGQESRIRTTLRDPDFVLYSRSDDNYQYHRFFSKTPVAGKHLLVVVKHLDDEGFVITAFFLRKVNERGKVRVYEREGESLHFL